MRRMSFAVLAVLSLSLAVPATAEARALDTGPELLAGAAVAHLPTPYIQTTAVDLVTGQTETSAPAPTVSAAPNILDQILTPGGIAAVIAVIGTVLGLLLGPSAIRKRRVALATYHAFHVVEDLDDELGSTRLDKVRAGLKAADDWMKAQGWRTLKPGEQEVAELGFKALNGQQKLATKIAADAQAEALARVAVPSPQ